MIMKAVLVFIMGLSAAFAVCSESAVISSVAPPGPASNSQVLCAIRGIIEDQQGLPIEGARVVLQPTDRLQMTDSTGHFCFDSKEGGKRLVADKAGFVQVTQDLAEFAEFRFTLRPTFRHEIVVSATQSEQRLDSVPVRIDLVNPEIIEYTGARTLGDALEFTTGVRIESNCQNCNFTQARLLGLDGAYSQILVDGQPLISSLAQVYGIEQIPSRMLDRIEVIKGGGSAIYGAGSVAGAINIIPRKPKRTGGMFENRMEWMDGQPNHAHSAFMDYASKDGNTSLTVFGQLDRMKAIDFDGDEYSEVGFRKFNAVGTRFDRVLIKGKAAFTMDFSHIYESRRGGNKLDLPEHEADVAESIKSRRSTFSAGWRHSISPTFDYRLNASFVYTQRDTYYGAGMDPNAYGETENPLLVLDSQLNHYKGNHVVSWGVQHSSDHLEDTQPGYNRFTDEVYRNLGLYAQDSWSFAEGWEALLGIRLDKHNAVSSVFASPRAAIKYSPLPTVNIRGTYARGFRPPQVFDEDLHITQVGGEGAVILNDSDLRHESANSFMLGVEWTPSSGIHNGLIEVNTFYTGLQDLFKVIDADIPSTDDREFLRTNLGGARVRGVEINLGYAIGDRFKAEGGIVFQNGRYNEPEPDFGSRHFFKTPSRHGNLSVIYKQPRVAEFFIGLRYGGSMYLPHYAGYIEEDRLAKTKSYTVIDASITRGIPWFNDSHVELIAGFKNLTNEYQQDLDKGPNRDAGYVYGPRFPRTFSATLKFEF
jgi:outer membrane receptor for ferrienterochelin and colicins